MTQILKPIFDLRWRLEYNDGTPAKYGPWTRDAYRQEEMATFQKRENLARALVEMKDKRNGYSQTAVHCSGQDFVNFKWVRGGSYPYGKSGGRPVILYSQIIGMVLVTRELEATVYVDGREPEIKFRSDEDKNYHYAGFGK